MLSLKRLYLKTLGKILPTDLFASRFPVSVKGICFIEGRVILVMNEHLKWDLPGGKLDKGETLHECLIREMKEELGIQVEPIQLVDIMMVNVRGWVSVLVPVYVCQTDACHDDLILSHEHARIECFLPDQVTGLPLAADYGALIDRSVLDGKFH